MTSYDVIVIGARCAGAPTAMLLARQGLRVLLVDRARFPSDTVSTHVVQPHGVARLAAWGLIGDVVDTGCPPLHTYSFDFGPVVISGSPGTPEAPLAYAPRRYLLDSLLVRAAAAAGAEVREEFSVDELLVEDGRVVGVRGRDGSGRRTIERARVTVGADGIHSVVARSVGAESYADKPPLLCGYYAYWSGVPTAGTFETYIRPARGFAAVETNDDLTLVIAGWPYSEFGRNKADLERHYRETFDLAPHFAERLRRGRRETRIVGSAVPNFFRQPYGAGWALVGDAGYTRDFITAQGISDAFRDAELCATALVSTLGGSAGYEEAMRSYQETRDSRVRPMYEMTTALATLEPPSAELQATLAGIAGHVDAMNEFVRVNAGTQTPALVG